MKQLLLLITILTGSMQAMVAQNFQSPVTWTFRSEKVSDTEYDLHFNAKVDAGWHLYSQDIKEGGPIPTTFEFETTDGVSLEGKVAEEGKLISEYSSIFAMDLNYYKKEASFTQRIKLNGDKANVAGYLTFMTCNDKTCLAPTDVDFAFSMERSTTPPVEEITETEPPSPEEEVIKETTAPKETADVVTTAENVFEQPSQPIDIAPAQVDEIAPETNESETSNNGLLEPVTWTTKIAKLKDDELEVVFEAKIEEGWVVYSQFVNPDEGPLPTVIEFEEGVEKLGEATEEGEKSSGIDKVFGIEVTKFKKRFILKQRIKATDAGANLVGYIDYMTCNDEKCIASSYDFAYQQNGLPIAQAGPTEDKGPQMVDGSRFGNPVQECGEVLNFTSLWVTFIKGFLGGLVALLTPCVFPMIPLTVSFFTKQSKNKSEGIRNAGIYGVSIIVIYVALGSTLTAIFGAQIMNELSTNMILNLLFFALFVLFEISFFGFFELTLPSSWANRTDRMADRGGFLGIFFMAFTLGIVSFSCTGPIIGTLLIESFKSQGAMIGNFNLAPPIGMLGFSTALALPFTMFAAFPGWLNSLPRSGGWMVTVKVVLGFLELALALKFLSVVDMTQHWGFLRFELFLGLWIAIFLGLALYLFGLIKFPHDPPKPKVGIPRAALGAISFVFAAYMIFGLINYKSLPVLSGLAPPAHYNFFNPSDCPLGIDCYKDYDEALAESQRTGKPLFIDFTGFGCVNCRKMEELVWIKPKIMQKLTNDMIVVSLYVDDRTKLAEPYISTFDGAKKRTVGNKWADFQAIHFGANSQPYYAMVSPDEQLLNIPVGYTPDVEEFDYFLECGLEAFGQLSERLSEQ
ncbi:MAG: protein-disulfide reductase DsbD domain-containing protein [Bacteroidota bacterium]